jgi:hypothetical protein
LRGLLRELRSWDWVIFLCLFGVPIFAAGQALTSAVVGADDPRPAPVESTVVHKGPPETVVGTKVFADAAPTGIFNVRTYGALGDGLADDTAAIQSAIDAAIGGPGGDADADDAKARGRPAVGSVYLPPGRYRVTRPLRFYSVAYLRFHGEGGSSSIVPDGEMDSVLDINGAAWCEWSRFRIDGEYKARATDVVSLEWNPDVASRSTSQCRFQLVDVMRFASFDYGFNVGGKSAGRQVDCSYLEHCTVLGDRPPGSGKPDFKAAFRFGGGVHGNNLSHALVHPITGDTLYGIEGRGSLPLTITGGSIGHHEADFLWQSSGPLSVIGVRSEASQRLLVSGGGGGWDSIITFRDHVFMGGNLHPDGRLIAIVCGGRLKLDGLQLPGVRPGIPPFVESVAFTPICVVVEDVLAPTKAADFVKAVGGTRGMLRVRRSGYRQIGTDGKVKWGEGN